MWEAGEKITWSNSYQCTQISIKTWDFDKERALKSQPQYDDDDDINKHTNQKEKNEFCMIPIWNVYLISSSTITKKKNENWKKQWSKRKKTLKPNKCVY